MNKIESGAKDSPVSYNLRQNVRENVRDFFRNANNILRILKEEPLSVSYNFRTGGAHGGGFIRRMVSGKAATKLYRPNFIHGVVITETLSYGKYSGYLLNQVPVPYESMVDINFV